MQLNGVNSLSSGLEWPRVLPAPMEGVMGPLFCQAMVKLQLTDAWFTPFLRITTGVPGLKVMERFAEPFVLGGLPVLLQLMGDHPERLAKAAKQAMEATDSFCGINLNLACPSKTVLKGGSGGALMKDLPRALDCVLAMREAIPKHHFDVKIRLGFDQLDQGWQMIEGLRHAGVDLLYIHFRTVREQYGRVDGRAERMAEAVRIANSVPVYGSGDVFTVNDAQAFLDAGCVGVLAGRGLAANPGLVRNLEKGQNLPLTRLFVLNFFDAMLEAGRERPDWFHVNAFAEAGRWMLGPRDPLFLEIVKMKPADLLGIDRFVAKFGHHVDFGS